MSKKKAENKVKITALYCRLSVEDTKDVKDKRKKKRIKRSVLKSPPKKSASISRRITRFNKLKMKSLNSARKIIAINKEMRGENMVQKVNFKDVLVMKGMGRVDDTRPIDLQEYVMPTSKERKSTPIPLTTVPKKICFSKKIAGTIYDVTANFDLEGKETILQQFKALILAKEL